MQQQSYPKPLWIISFDRNQETGDWRHRAHLSRPQDPTALLPTLNAENQLVALDFVEKLNTSFRAVAEAYLSELEKEKGGKLNPADLQKMRDRFSSLDHWIHWIREMLQKPDDQNKPS